MAQMTASANINLSKLAGNQAECSAAVNPSSKLQVYAVCNHDTAGLFAARSNDGGTSWTPVDATDSTIADGDANQGPQAWSDPNVVWDTFGNLYVTYIDHSKTNVVTILSTDGGSTFSTLATFGPGTPDQPSIVFANTSGGGAAAMIWIVWDASGQLAARGAPVTGAGTANVGPFIAQLTLPGTTDCSFGDIAISPAGAVVQVCEMTTATNNGQGPAAIKVSRKTNGLGAGNFTAAATVVTSNVGPLDKIPAQPSRTIDAEPGLAYDRNPLSPRFGRLYLVYTDEAIDENNDTNIFVMSSDDDGGTWSAATRVDDDSGTRSQFFSKIASNSDSGDIAVCWLDCRNSSTNTAVEEFCTMSTPATYPSFILPSVRVSASPTTSPGGSEFGDYQGLAYFMGRAFPVWPDRSNSTGDNPQGTSTLEAYSSRVMGGAAANEGDPHMTTVNGVNYDFQGGGEFIALRDPDGLEIQTRQTPISTTFDPGPGSFGLGVCVSLNSAVATRVGPHRVTYEPNVSGVPDPTGMQLRIDGVLTTLGSAPIHLSGGGTVAQSGVSAGAIAITFPDATNLYVTPLFWASQGKWFLNVDVTSTGASEGLMGSIPAGSWLPALPDGSSIGPLPATLHDRYVALYQRFADAWRVSDKNTLFDYAAGTSTSTFTFRDWPGEHGPCRVADEKPATPLPIETAQSLCADVVERVAKENCTFDVHVTGAPEFAKLYLLTQRLLRNGTRLTVTTAKNPSAAGEVVMFLARASKRVVRGEEKALQGTVQFYVDGEKAGAPVPLDQEGRAVRRTAALRPGQHRVWAEFIPAKGSGALAVSSDVTMHVTRQRIRK